MSLPYHWFPSGTTHKPLPAVGDLVGLDHAVWLVVEVTERHDAHWTDDDRRRVAAYKPEFQQIHKPHAVRLRPISQADASKDKHYICGGARYSSWSVYRSDHWPACGKCGEPSPCREVMADRTAEQAIQAMNRWNTPGVCPACSEPVSLRQQSHTFQHNLNIPGGPPVTFHVGRRACRYRAGKYRDELAAAGHDISEQLEFGKAS